MGGLVESTELLTTECMERIRATKIAVNVLNEHTGGGRHDREYNGISPEVKEALLTILANQGTMLTLLCATVCRVTAVQIATVPEVLADRIAEVP